MRRLAHGALALFMTVCLAGCDNELEDLPITTPPVTTTEEFTGTIGINGASTHTFIVVATGTSTATITEITPDPAIAVGFLMGTWNGSACAASIAMDNAIQGNTITGTSSGVGTLCVRIHDNGKLVEPITYKLRVVHP